MSRSPIAASAAPPRRPPWPLERFSLALFRALSPRLPRIEQPPPPDALAPFETLSIARGERGGELSATWYPAGREARGAVLLLPPWLEWGRSYFHRRGRIEALRAAGYDALTCDLSGFGTSSAPRGFYDRDVEAALDELERRAPGKPLHLWGVSSGGHWAHPVLSRRDGIAGAFFEDVSPHLIEWSHHVQPLGRPFYWIFEYLTGPSYRFIDMRRHAPHLRVEAAAYVGGELDTGVLADDTRTLARLAGADCMIVDGARHLGAIRLATERVIELALATFERAERRARSRSS